MSSAPPTNTWNVWFKRENEHFFPYWAAMASETFLFTYVNWMAIRLGDQTNLPTPAHAIFFYLLIGIYVLHLLMRHARYYQGVYGPLYDWIQDRKKTHSAAGLSAWSVARHAFCDALRMQQKGMVLLCASVPICLMGATLPMVAGDFAAVSIWNLTRSTVAVFGH